MILGAIFLRNYDVLFDRTDHEIHFTKADCDKQLTDIYLNIQFHNQTENETKTHETFTTVEEVLSQNASKTPDNEAKNQSKLIDFTLNLTNSSEKITFETVDYNNTINTTNQSKDYDVDIDDDNEDDNAINETDSLGSNTSLKYSNISNLSNAYLEMEKGEFTKILNFNKFKNYRLSKSHYRNNSCCRDISFYSLADTNLYKYKKIVSCSKVHKFILI